jgi:hypothetical protein
MALNTAIFAADLASVIADLPVTCSYEGTEFTATSSDDARNRAVEIDGMVLEMDRAIVVATADLPTGVEADSKITVGGKTYRVLSLSEHQDGIATEIRLKADVR